MLREHNKVVPSRLHRVVNHPMTNAQISESTFDDAEGVSAATCQRRAWVTKR